MQVKATREGLLGHRMASGIPCLVHLPFVALPSVKALYRFVALTNPATKKTTLAICLDVGPHHTHDDAYVFGDARPLAESDPGSNGAGIDLSETTWAALGMTDNGPVDWTFIS